MFRATTGASPPLPQKSKAIKNWATRQSVTTGRMVPNCWRSPCMPDATLKDIWMLKLGSDSACGWGELQTKVEALLLFRGQLTPGASASAWAMIWNWQNDMSSVDRAFLPPQIHHPPPLRSRCCSATRAWPQIQSVQTALDSTPQKLSPWLNSASRKAQNLSPYWASEESSNRTPSYLLNNTWFSQHAPIYIYIYIYMCWPVPPPPLHGGW